MKNDPWNGLNPEDDLVFQTKIQTYRTEQAIERELAHEEISLRFAKWAAQPRVDLKLGCSTLLCAVCVRVPLHTSATSLACTNCQAWDALLGNHFGSTGFLGLDVQTSSLLPGKSAPETVKNAAIEGLFTSLNLWLGLYDWQHTELSTLAQDAGWEHQTFVPLTDWESEYRGTPGASLDAYLRLLQTRHSWLKEVAPEALRASWYRKQWQEHPEPVDWP